MAIVNSKSDELHAQIAMLQRRIKLSNSQEQKALLTDEIYKVKKQLRELNRKAPKVVAIKDASTVGDKLEAKLNGKAGNFRMGNRAVLI